MTSKDNKDTAEDAKRKFKEAEMRENPIARALKLLAGMDTDHASEENGEGFNKTDTELGHTLANKEILTYEELKTAKTILRKYKAQLGANLYLEVINFTPSKKSDAEKQENMSAIYKTRFNLDGFHYAEFSDDGQFRFLKYRDGSFEVVDSVEVPDPEDSEKKYTVMPAPQIAQTKKDRILQEEETESVKFPGKPQGYDSEYRLFNEIRGFIHTYVELRPDDEIVLSLYTLKAVLFDALKDSSFPFVHMIAPYGKGKSRLLTVLCELTPYGFYAIDIKSAPLKRVSELYKVILFVDEKGQMDQETSAMINAKYNRNSIVLNASTEIQSGFSSIIGYSIYGPMLLAGREPFKDDAIESKSLQINMDYALNREDIPRKIKGKVYDGYMAKARELRSKLLQFRINWHDKINNVQPSEFLKKYEDKTEPRLFEVISFFEDLIELIPEIKPEITEVLEDQIIRNVEVARGTPNGIIAETVLSKIDSGEDQCEYTINGKAHMGIYLTSIYEDIGENYKQRAGRILAALGIKTDRPRIEFTRKTQDRTETYKKKISVVRIPDDKKLNELKSRYDPEYMKAILGSISKAQQSIVDKQDEQDEQRGTPSKKNEEKGDNEKKVGTFHNNRPNSPNRPALDGEPAISNVQSDFSTSKEMRGDAEHVNVLPEKFNAEITKELIKEIRERLATEKFILDGNTGPSFDKKEFQLYVYPTELSLERFIHLKEIMQGFGFDYSSIQEPYGIRFIRKFGSVTND